MKNFEEIMSERKNRIEARKDELIRRSLLSEEFLEMIQKNKRPFDLLMSYYQCAVMEIETKFRVLNQEYSLEYDKNPIEGIKTRIKSYDSIVRKIRRKNIPMSLTAIEENIKGYRRCPGNLFFSGGYLLSWQTAFCVRMILY